MTLISLAPAIGPVGGGASDRVPRLSTSITNFPITTKNPFAESGLKMTYAIVFVPIEQSFLGQLQAQLNQTS